MTNTTIDRRETAYFSEMANQLVYHQEKWSDFLSNPFSIENIKKSIESKSTFSLENRKTLASVLTDYYSKMGCFNRHENTIKSLQSKNTFTVTTGHQLSLFTGPLYFIYKIIHVITLAEELKAHYPNFNFVPVYWMASEDHDFAEVNHFKLFNEIIQWDSNQEGAVGKFDTKELEEIKALINKKFENNLEFAEWVSSQYSNNLSYGEATFKLVEELFSFSDLLIIEPDNSALKQLFQPMMQKEIEEQFSYQAVEATNEKLSEHGVKLQVNPREVNLFYLEKSGRHRIISEGENFSINGSSITKSDLCKELKNYPERFSPNVVLRPLYQDVILPNLVYVGGGGEIAYWLQLKGVFDACNIPFPLIQVRNSIQLIDNNSSKKLSKLGFSISTIFKPSDELKKQFIFDNASKELNFEELEHAAEEMASKMESLISAVDGGLDGYAKSESVKIRKQLEQVKSKMIRHQKKKHDDAMQQIDNLKNRLFPDNILQERKDNFLEWASKSDIQTFISTLFKRCNPLEKDIIVVLEKEFHGVKEELIQEK